MYDMQGNYSPGTPPSVAAIVVTYYSGSFLKECIYALCANTEVSEIIVVNNGNDKATMEWLTAFEAKNDRCSFQLISGHGNIGMGSGVNLGAKNARSDRLLIINPDAVLRVGSIPKLEAALQSSTSSPRLVGGRIFYPNGEEQRGGRRELLTMSSAFVSFTGLANFEKIIPAFRNVHREKDPEPTGPVPMPVISGALCYMTRKDFEAVNGFDEQYFLHVEDIDLCRRVALLGGEVIYTPKAGALHYGSTSKVSANFVQWHKAQGLSKYFKKFAKSPLERSLAGMSLYLFAGLLMGRTTMIQSFQKLRDLFR